MKKTLTAFDIPFEDFPRKTGVSIPVAIKHDCGTTHHVRGKGGKFGWYSIDHVHFIHRNIDG